MFRAHNRTTGEFRVFTSFPDLCRYMDYVCSDTDEISYVKLDPEDFTNPELFIGE